MQGLLARFAHLPLAGKAVAIGLPIGAVAYFILGRKSSSTTGSAPIGSGVAIGGAPIFRSVENLYKTVVSHPVIVHRTVRGNANNALSYWLGQQARQGVRLQWLHNFIGQARRGHNRSWLGDLERELARQQAKARWIHWHIGQARKIAKPKG